MADLESGEAAIRRLLYLCHDTQIVEYLGGKTTLDQVARVRAKAKQADGRIMPGGARSPAVAPDNGLGSTALANEQTRTSSEKLLIALLRYGLRHDGLPGLTREQFYARCRETAVLL